MSQPRVVQTGALPANTVKPLEAGSTNVFQSAAIKSTNANNAQNNLINGPKSGGKRRNKKLMRGGANGVASNSAPVVVVAGATSYDTNKGGTNTNNTNIAILANNAKAGAAYDNTVGKGPSETAAISAQQQAIYSGKGGSRRRRHTRKGGSVPIWGCFSGGKKSRSQRRHNKNCKCKGKKTRKHLKRYHHR
jgi:hypothetical protein